MKSTRPFTPEAIEAASRRYEHDVAIIRMMLQSRAGMDLPDRENAEAFLHTRHVGLAYDRLIEEHAKTEPRRSYVDENGEAREIDEGFLKDAQRGKPDPEKRAAIEAALRKADQGEFISADEMNGWIDSWEGDEETSLPSPASRVYRQK